eukprot:TRINITY_DN3438_c0_g1_i3.p1 TRINITY_DN3438_c0_g1~~TRINITY_DN3438_c0_g1_i3.p1  ORF type:complete len:431 (-),score=198.29 TRINITY_DN3438_c0_g1_i3:182-1474(-)
MEVEPAPQGETGTISGLLGLGESELDELKSAAKPVLLPGQLPRSKRPKLRNTDFFDDDRGFNKLIKTFPRLSFKGKGRELEDLNLLLCHYEKWLKDLYPTDEHFENMVWKARQVLLEPEMSEDGILSDPREKLHMLRYEYKKAGGAGTVAAQARMKEERERVAAEAKRGTQISDEARQRMEANRQRALALKRQREAAAAGGGGSASSSSAQAATGAPSSAQEEAKLRLEANRLAAMERKRQREEEKAMLELLAEQEAMFEEVAGPPPSQPAAAAAAAVAEPVAPQAAQAPPKAPAAAAFDEFDEDPFGWGGAFEEEPFDMQPPPKPAAPSRPATTPAAVPQAVQPAAAHFDFEEEEDPFGLGMGFEDDFAMPAAPPKAAAPKPPAPAASAVPAAAPAAAAPPAAAPPQAAAEGFFEEEEEDPFGFGCGMD